MGCVSTASNDALPCLCKLQHWKDPQYDGIWKRSYTTIEAVIGKPAGDEEATDPDDYLSKVQTGLLNAHDVARANLKKAANYHMRYYDTHSRKVRQRHLEAGMAP